MNHLFGYTMAKRRATHRVVMSEPYYVEKYGRFWGWTLIYALKAFEALMAIALLLIIVFSAAIVLS